MAKFSILTLGCKVNQCESAAFEDALKGAGIGQADPSERADLCIVNTCAVTGRAAMQSRQTIRAVIRNHPGAKVVVTGCYAEAAADELMRIPGVHRVLGRVDKARSVEIALRLIAGAEPHVPLSPADAFNDPFFPVSAKPAGGRHRPFLKVQDGCDAFCTYCIVPHTRGASRSLPPDRVIENLREYKRQGFEEAVLTGIHLGAYGRDLSPATDLYGLLCRIVEAEVIGRVRISSVEPMEVTEAIVTQVAQTDRLCPHFHVPLQSGDDEVLRRMRRPYTRDAFSERVLMIREKIPDAAVGVDILAGFPGETRQAFENTFRLVESLPIAYLHVFPFSARKATPAAGFPDPVPPRVVKARCEVLRGLGLKKKAAFIASQVGRKLQVIVEGGGDGTPARLHGTSENYICVAFEAARMPQNKMAEVRIEGVEGSDRAWGRLTAS